MVKKKYSYIIKYIIVPLVVVGVIVAAYIRFFLPLYQDILYYLLEKNSVEGDSVKITSGRIFIVGGTVLIGFLLEFYGQRYVKRYTEYHKGKKYRLFVYGKIYALLLSLFMFGNFGVFCTEMSALRSGYYESMFVTWNVSLVARMIILLVIVLMGRQRLVVDGERIYYSNLTRQYKGSVRDVDKMEIVNDTIQIRGREFKRARLVVTMKDETMLVVYDMNDSDNRKVYDQLKEFMS